ncbi:MAG TPA: ABC transporter substrate-binding protein [Oscillospiraceae bacterium]|nr:ABC transporter substrate-binding protein [Oscillospiraceae bacterium]
MRRISAALLSVLLLLSLLTGCQAGKAEEKQTLALAQQFGIAYAPIEIMRQQQLLEKRLPDVTVTWQQYGGPTAIREGMLAGDIDIGFVGIVPVLIGIDTGMPWRYLCGLSRNEVAIMVRDPDVHSLADLASKDKVAILSPACTQHVILALACEKEFGDPNALDSRLVSMSHPDSAAAMASGTEIVAHVATPPYIQEEVDAGAHAIYTGDELMGGSFTFVTCVALEQFYADKPDYCTAFLDALEEADAYIAEHPEEAAAALAPVYGITEEEILSQIDYGGGIFSTELQGVDRMIAAMYRMGFIQAEPDPADTVFDTSYLAAEDAS